MCAEYFSYYIQFYEEKVCFLILNQLLIKHLTFLTKDLCSDLLPVFAESKILYPGETLARVGVFVLGVPLRMLLLYFPFFVFRGQEQE